MNDRILTSVVAFVALFVWAGYGCGGDAQEWLPRIRILEPRLWQDAVTYEPLYLEIDLHPFADQKTFEVELNGVDITDRFTIEWMPPRDVATAIDVWGDGLVLPGTNVLVARVEEYQVTRTFQAVGDPHADAVADFVPGAGAGYGQAELPGVVTGPPEGLGLFLGGLDVLSLGAGGRVELEFVDNVIVDRPGVDFTVFENAFLTVVLGLVGNPFAEPGLVSVSQDGVTWYPFDDCQTAPLDPPLHPGCAGVAPTLSDANDPLAPHPSIPTETPIGDLIGQPVGSVMVPEGSGGDSFDLEDVGLSWARFVRIEDVGPALGQDGTVGLDLDAVTAVNSAVPTDANENGIPDAVE